MDKAEFEDGLGRATGEVWKPSPQRSNRPSAFLGRAKALPIGTGLAWLALAGVAAAVSPRRSKRFEPIRSSTTVRIGNGEGAVVYRNEKIYQESKNRAGDYPMEMESDFGHGFARAPGEVWNSATRQYEPPAAPRAVERRQAMEDEETFNLIMPALLVAVVALLISALGFGYAEAVMYILLGALGLSVVAILGHLLLSIVGLNKKMKALAPKQPELWEELLSKGFKGRAKMSAGIDAIKDRRSKALAVQLLESTDEFLSHARKDTTKVVSEQRFVNYYLQRAVDMVDAAVLLSGNKSRNAQEIGQVQQALEELVPVFEHYASSMQDKLAPNMDLELKLLRDSIRQDVP